MAEQPLIEWNSGLFDCFEDVATCCYGFWCCPCLAITVSERFGENRCLPLCDICTPAIAYCGIPPCVVRPAVLSLRVAMRNRYGIKGSLCKDIAAACCCETCAWCQMHRELKHRKKTPTVIVNVTNVNVQQPAPVMMAPINPAPMMAAPECPAPGMMAPINPVPMMAAPEFPAPGMMAPINPVPMMAAPEFPAPGIMVPQYPAPIGPENPAQMMMPPEQPAPMMMGPIKPAPMMMAPVYQHQ
ncbi:protein PLANT CADMIUM RESISTANCE 9 [Etheostoma spectabile]|uniref:protein PLANT CADMIUM RESISTANCE 9 n=1 Tax=Etheostoma spectabile TaxID=54343 RepID=UPI0013AF653C|nr:protein PLANT CADMIUM RESISTANCE 9-like [Etheostoma spectabile]